MIKPIALATSAFLLAPALASASEDTPDPVFLEPNRGIAPLTVGPDPECDFTSIDSAVSAQLDGGDVRVKTGTYSETSSVFIDKDLTLTGGYSSCSPGATVSGRSTITREGSGLVVDIFYSAVVGAPVRRIELENLVITNGGGSGFASGGVVVEGRPGRLLTEFRNVEISNNSRTGVDDDGGGMRIITTGDRDGPGPLVTLDNDSVVIGNSTAGDGGGIHCRSTHDQGTATLVRVGSTLVFDNSAENGGGIALDGCQNVFLYNGGPLVLIFPAGGIVANTAMNYGGGLYLVNGGEAELRGLEFGGFGNPDEAALIAGNGAVRGGGAYVEGLGTSLVVEDAYTINNTSSSVGGGFYAANDAILNVRRNQSAGRCDPPVSGGGVLSRPRCSVVEGNAGFGGALAASQTSGAEFSRTVIRDNTDGSSATAPIARLSFGAVVDFEGVLFDGNTGGFGIDVRGGSIANIAFSTIVNNSGVVARALAGSGETSAVNFYSSVIESQSEIARAQGDGTAITRFDCVLSNLSTADWGGTMIVQSTGGTDPQFRDPDSGDFRLGDRSPAIDYCDDFTVPDFDGLDGNPRGVGWTGPQTDPASGSAPGPYDIGAYEMVFQDRAADLAFEIVDPDTFVDADQASVSYSLSVTNNGPETAFSTIAAFDDVTAGVLENRSWTCFPGPGVSCTPGSGSGPVAIELGDMAPGDQVLVSVNADLIDTTADDSFIYAGGVVPSAFNVDGNAGNDSDSVEVRIGLFSDGFESPPVLP